MELQRLKIWIAAAGCSVAIALATTLWIVPTVRTARAAGTEPPSPELPLFSLDNFWGTPHHAGLSKKASMACATGAAKAIDDVLHGREPQYPVNHPKKKKEG